MCVVHIYVYMCVVCVYVSIRLYSTICVSSGHIVYVYMCVVHIYVYMCVRICIYVSTRLYSTMCPKAYVSSGHIVIYSNMCPIYILLGTQV